MKMKLMLVGACAVLSMPAVAQDTTTTATTVVTEVVEAVKDAAAQSSAMQQIILAPNSEVMVTVPELVTSKKIKEGDSFQIKTMFDVMQDGVIVIPKGTFGDAKVTWRTGKGAFGKSAKIEVAFESLTLSDGRKLALTGTHRQEGQGNTGATVGAVAAAGLIGGVFVTGRSAELKPGQQLIARTAEPATFEIAAGTPRIVTATVAPQMAAEPVAAEGSE
jgi:hypothetical protein